MNRRVLVLPAALLAVGLLASCASDDTASEATSSEPAALCPITVADSWVKAAESGMTAAFGTLTNAGSTEAVIVSATSDAAGRMEIHEVVSKDGAMVMQPKEGGLVIPAGGSATLAPGQDHLMLMEIPAPIEPGDTVEIMMTCADGGTAPYSGVAKPFEGGAEPYEPGEGESMDSMSES
jgi:copper(I)-binding protein